MKNILPFFALAYLTMSAGLFAGTLAQDLKSIGVNPVIEKKFSPRLNHLSEAEDKYFLQVKLGRLSLEQFKALMKRYGNYSKVSYHPERFYELVDFLPPVMQGLVNKTFHGSYIPVSSRNQEISFIFKNGVSIVSNCFNTTFEIIRTLQNKKLEFRHRFFIPDRWSSTDVIQDNKFGQYVAPTQVRPFDVLYYIAKPDAGIVTLQHTAIYLSDDLVFEKTDSSENDPYRISFTQDVKAKYNRLLPDMFKSHKLLNRRFVGVNRALFPDLRASLESAPFSSPEMINKIPAPLKRMNLSMGCETGLGGGCDINFYDVQEIQFVINPKNGRGEAYGAPKVLKRLIAL